MPEPTTSTTSWLHSETRCASVVPTLFWSSAIRTLIIVLREFFVPDPWISMFPRDALPTERGRRGKPPFPSENESYLRLLSAVTEWAVPGRGRYSADDLYRAKPLPPSR